MAIITKQVHGILTKPDGKPWARYRIQFILQSGSFTPLHQLPPYTLKVQTDANGAFTTLLWANDEGEIPSAYTCILPNSDIFGFVLPATAPSPVELSVLREAGITEQHPQYKTILDFIAQYLATVGVGTADQILLKPAIPGLPPMVQGAIAAQQTEIATHNAEIVAQAMAIANLQAKPLPRLSDLPDVSMGTSQDGGALAYSAANQVFELSNLVDGGNF
jgi:hypothetical protein